MKYASSGLLWAVLWDVSGPLREPSGRLGASLRHLGAILQHLEATLERLGAILGPSSGQLEAPWGHLWAILASRAVRQLPRNRPGPHWAGCRPQMQKKSRKMPEKVV